MDRGYDITNKNLETRDKVRFLVDKIDNEIERPNIYNQVTVSLPRELSPNYLSNPANRGMDSKDRKLCMLNTERYNKANSTFYDTGVLESNNGNTSKMFFTPRLFF